MVETILVKSLSQAEQFRPSNEIVSQKLKKIKKKKKIFTNSNPPWSMDVATNVGQEMFEDNRFPFPPGHIVHSVLYRSTVNVSYGYLPNMGAMVAKHNSKLVKKSDRTPLSVCVKIVDIHDSIEIIHVSCVE